MCKSVVHAVSIDSIKLQEEENRSVVVKFVCLYKPNRVYLFESPLFGLMTHLFPYYLLIRLFEATYAICFEVVYKRAEEARYRLLFLEPFD